MKTLVLSLKAGLQFLNFLSELVLSQMQAPEGSLWVIPLAVEADSSLDRLLLLGNDCTGPNGN